MRVTVWTESVVKEVHELPNILPKQRVVPGADVNAVTATRETGKNADKLGFIPFHFIDNLLSIHDGFP